MSRQTAPPCPSCGAKSYRSWGPKMTGDSLIRAHKCSSCDVVYKSVQTVMTSSNGRKPSEKYLKNSGLIHL